MYPLGEQFKIDKQKAVSNPENIIKGDKYRITVLTERLIRLEYNNSGVFEDRPSEFALMRNFKRPNITVKEDKKYLEITSPYFRLFYIKERPFKGDILNKKKNLLVDVLETNRTWYFKHPEVRNYEAPGYAFDQVKNNKLNMTKGLYSIDGFVSVDDSKTKVFLESGELVNRDTNNNTIDIYLFAYGKDFEGCLKDYFALTGKPALIPRYALGNWWDKNEIYDDKSLKKLIDQFNEKNIPLSVLLLNSGWHKTEENSKNENKSGFSWNLDYFKSPQGMINYLHKHGIRIGLSVDPTTGIYPYEDNYPKFKEYLMPDENGVIPFNTYDPKFIDAYFKLLINPLENTGVDFFWLDITDKKKKYELWYLDHYHFLDMQKNYERRPMILTRNPFKTAHRYPVLYSGRTIVNWDSLKEVIKSNANAANMGISWWAHDIGGYYKGIEDNELYTRFVQLGVFSSIMKFGSEKGKYYKREPWRWGIKTFGIVRDYLELRHKMIPYLYSEAYRYYNDGIPVMRPVFYKFPVMYDDVNYRYEYFLGTELFISPIANKKDYVMNRVVHKFFMPTGIWYDFMTGKKFPGDKEYISFFKDQDYPVFAKSGAIIPLGYNDNLNDTTPPKNMEIHIFPGKSNTYNLYEDDGVSDLYKKGFYLLTQIDYNYMPSNYTVIIRALEGKSNIVPKTRNYKIRFRNTKEASEVKCYVKNEPIAFKKYTDGADFIVEVYDVSTISQLTINCKGKDIEIAAERLINDEIEEILSDLPIETEMKERIDAILFGDLPINKKRIAIRKLKRTGLEKKFIKVFLKLLEYLNAV